MVFALLGTFIGLAIGIAAGIWAGTRLFEKYFEDLDVGRFDIKADYDEKVPVPLTEGQPVPRRFRAFLKYFPNWATMPDFYRVTWANHMVKTLWPHYNQAIGKMVLETVKPQIDEIKKQYPFIEAIDIELIDFGTKPVRLAGIKVYSSTDDEVITETPFTWGSNACIRASARIRFQKWSFYIPIEISNFQMKVTARSTLRPLVDTLPCMGAVTVALVDTPHLDFSLHLFSRFDLMLLPGIRELAIATIQGIIGDMVQYPNKMTFDIMEGGGVPPPPVGMLQIRVSKVDRITAGGDLLSKVDPYIEVGVREDRSQRTKTIWNNKHPQFDEVFNLIVDNVDTQTLTFKLHDDDLGFNDPVLGIVEQDLADAEYINEPKKWVQLQVDFISVPALKKMKRLVKKRSEQERQPHKLPTAGQDDEGRKQYKIPDSSPTPDDNKQRKEKAKVATMHFDAMYIPFKDSRKDAMSNDPSDSQRDGASEGHAPERLPAAAAFSKVTDDNKGILTVSLKGCTNLQASDGDVDPFVLFELHDPKKVKPEVQRSTLMHHEPNPHWNQKFDFAMISGTSTLSIHIYDKKTALQAMLSNPVKSIAGKVTGKPTEADECIGSLRLKVSGVVRNERLKDVWALQETQKGDIHMTLDWRPITLEDTSELLEAGDQREVQQRRKEQEEDARRERQKSEGGGQGVQKSPKSHHHLHMPHFHKKDKEKGGGDARPPRQTI